MGKKLRNRRAVSPVIATVILVAVAITVAVAVAYWMGGIASQYTQFEKVEIQSAYAVKSYDSGVFIGWDIQMTLKNSGTSTATLINCFINEKIIGGTELPGVNCTSVPDTGTIGEATSTGITVDSGESSEITISLIDAAFSSSGTTLNIKLHSAAGMDYIKLIQLP